MNPLMRVLAVGAAVALVIAIARLASRWQRPTRPPIDLDGLGSRPGVIVFTSNDCGTCVEATGIVRRTGVEARDVAWEREPAVFERYGIDAVPLVVVLDAEGNSFMFETGVPDARRLSVAIRKAGVR